MPNVITTCEKCGCRYEYFFDGLTYLPCPKCGFDPIGDLERAGTIDLIKQLHDSNMSTRNNAAVMLGERHVQEAVEPLLAMLREEGAGVEPGVIIALGHLREKRAVDNLVSILYQGKNWRTERARLMDGPGRVIDALVQIGTDEALEAVLATDALDFSINTIRELSRFKCEKVAAALAKVALEIGDDDCWYGWEKVVVAVESLGEVGGELAISALKGKLDSYRKQIALAARKSLDKIGAGACP